MDGHSFANPTGQIGAPGRLARRGSHRTSIERTVTIAMVGLVQAILILGSVVASLGLANDGGQVAGPDRPPVPMVVR
jgi:hypothetical protein